MFIRICPNKPTSSRPHVHISLGKGPGRARMKVWLDTVSLAKSSGEWPRKKAKAALDTVFVNKSYLLDEWAKMFG